MYDFSKFREKQVNSGSRNLVGAGNGGWENQEIYAGALGRQFFLTKARITDEITQLLCGLISE